MQEGLVARNNNIVGYFKRIFTDYLENIGAITKSVQYCNYDTTKRLLTYEIQLIPTDNEFGVSFKTFCDCLADYIQMSPATDKLFMTFTNLATPTLSIVTQDISFYDATHTSQRFTYTLTAYVTLSDDQLTALKNGNVIFDATGLTYMRIS